MSSEAIPANKDTNPIDGLSVLEQGRMQSRRRALQIRRRLLRSPGGIFGAVIVILVLSAAALAPALAPHDPNVHDLRNRFQGPAWTDEGSWTYILGTDQLGRDILSRIIFGARVSVIVGICSVAIAGTLGMIAGLVSGFFGGAVDAIIMRFADAFLSIPFIILVVAIAGMVGGGLITIIVILGLTGWVAYSRVVRGETLAIKEREYIEAVNALGQNKLRILQRHVLPNTLSSVVVMATLEVARVILAESTLSFLGLGVQPPTVTWGLMLAEGRDHIRSAWWIVTFPGLAITVTVLGVVLLGDFLRDILDPRITT